MKTATFIFDILCSKGSRNIQPVARLDAQCLTPLRSKWQPKSLKALNLAAN
jgi:hypothetical protein